MDVDNFHWDTWSLFNYKQYWLNQYVLPLLKTKFQSKKVRVKNLDKLKIQTPTKTDLITGVIIFLLLLIIVKSYNFESFEKHKSGKEYFKPNLYKVNKGIITHKYIDNDNHAYKTIEFTINDSLEYYYILDLETELYEYIKISDSIIKTNLGNEIIIRRNKSDSIFKLDLKDYNWKRTLLTTTCIINYGGISLSEIHAD